MLLVKRLVLVGVASALSAFFTAGFATTAQASPISFYNDPTSITPTTTARGTLTCTLACSVLYETTGVYSTSVGGVFTVHPPNETIETGFVNGNLKAGDAAYTIADAAKTENAPSSFSTNALYVLMKIGGGNTFATMLIRNDSGTGALGLSWSGNSGSGLSHYTEFGELAPPIPTPLPAASLLLATALGGLGHVARRRRKAA